MLRNNPEHAKNGILESFQDAVFRAIRGASGIANVGQPSFTCRSVPVFWGYALTSHRRNLAGNYLAHLEEVWSWHDSHLGANWSEV